MTCDQNKNACLFSDAKYCVKWILLRLWPIVDLSHKTELSILINLFPAIKIFLGKGYDAFAYYFLSPEENLRKHCCSLSPCHYSFILWVNPTRRGCAAHRTQPHTMKPFKMQMYVAKFFLVWVLHTLQWMWLFAHCQCQCQGSLTQELRVSIYIWLLL